MFSQYAFISLVHRLEILSFLIEGWKIDREGKEEKLHPIDQMNFKNPNIFTLSQLSHPIVYSPFDLVQLINSIFKHYAVPWYTYTFN